MSGWANGWLITIYLPQVALEQRPKSITIAETELKEANYTGQILIQKAESAARILEYQ